MEGRFGRFNSASGPQNTFSAEKTGHTPSEDELDIRQAEIFIEVENNGISIRENTVETFIGPASLSAIINGTEEEAAAAIKKNGFVEKDELQTPELPQNQTYEAVLANAPIDVFIAHAIDMAG